MSEHDRRVIGFNTVAFAKQSHSRREAPDFSAANRRSTTHPRPLDAIEQFPPYGGNRLRACLNTTAESSDSIPVAFAKQSHCRREAVTARGAVGAALLTRGGSVALAQFPVAGRTKPSFLQNKAIRRL
jgi:hypothetical protein